MIRISGLKVEILKVLFCLFYGTGTFGCRRWVGFLPLRLYLCVSSCFVRSKKFKGCVDDPHFN